MEKLKIGLELLQLKETIQRATREVKKKSHILMIVKSMYLKLYILILILVILMRQKEKIKLKTINTELE